MRMAVVNVRQMRMLVLQHTLIRYERVEVRQTAPGHARMIMIVMPIIMAMAILMCHGIVDSDGCAVHKARQGPCSNHHQRQGDSKYKVSDSRGNTSDRPTPTNERSPQTGRSFVPPNPRSALINNTILRP